MADTEPESTPADSSAGRWHPRTLLGLLPVRAACAIVLLISTGCSHSEDQGPVQWREIRLAAIDYLSRNPRACVHTRHAALENLADESFDAKIISDELTYVNH